MYSFVAVLIGSIVLSFGSLFIYIFNDMAEKKYLTYLIPIINKINKNKIVLILIDLNKKLIEYDIQNISENQVKEKLNFKFDGFFKDTANEIIKINFNDFELRFPYQKKIYFLQIDYVNVFDNLNFINKTICKIYLMEINRIIYKISKKNDIEYKNKLKQNLDEKLNKVNFS